MENTIFLLFTAMLACSLFMLVAIFLRHKTNFVQKYGVNFILVLLVASLVRLFVPYEFGFSRIIASYKFLPTVLDFVRIECFTFLEQVITVGDIILTIWVLGSILALCRLAFQICDTNHFVRHIKPLENSIAKKTLRKIVDRTTPHQRYSLLITDEISTPMLVGYFHPTILIPQLELSEDEFHYILLHEWTHFLQRDLWKKLILQIIIALLWWNPLIYIVKKDFDYVLEADCDKRVTNGLPVEHRIGYVEATLKVIRQILQTKPLNRYVAIHFVGTANSSKIAQRCELVLDPPEKMGKALFYGLNVSLVCMLLLSYAFVVQPRGLQSHDTDTLLPYDESTYLVLTKDSQYKLYVDGVHIQSFTEESIDTNLLTSFVVIEEGE